MSGAATVRVAVLGYGYWGPNIVRTLQALPGVELAVCCDASPARLRDAQLRYGVTVVANWREVLADPAIDAVIIATPAHTHRELALAFLSHDKHVLVEKPFAANVGEAEEMYQTAERRALVLEAGHTFLYSPSVEILRQEVAAGSLGKVRTAFAVRASHGPRVRSDVDVTLDCMVHDVYILQELLGPAVAASANGSCVLTPGIADSAMARITFAGGAAAFCYASWYEPVKTRRLTLVGAEAMADYDDLREDEPVRILQRGYEPIEGVDAFGNQGLRHFDRGSRIASVAWEEPLRRELQVFIDRVCGRRTEPGVAPESVLAVAGTLDAIGRSMQRGGAPERVRGGTHG